MGRVTEVPLLPDDARATAGATLRIAVVAAVLAAALSASAMLVALGASPGQVLRVLGAAGGASLAGHGALRAAGRERRVRSWIAAAAALWLASELVRVTPALVDGDIGQAAALAELGIVAIGACAIGGWIAAARGRLRPADETALYLDACATFFAVTAAVLVIGAGFVTDADGMAVLVHAAFFVAVVVATLLLELSMHVPIRFGGQWELLGGLAFGALGYLGLVVADPAGPARLLFHAVVAAGALLVGHGGAGWAALEAPDGRYRRIADLLRRLVPLGSTTLAGFVAMLLITRPDVADAVGLRLGTSAALGLVVVCAVARQTVLLADRERMVRRERELTDELTVAEAQYRSVVERVPGVVYVAEAGQNGRWHFVSSKIEQLLGYTAEEWSADPTLWRSRLHPTDRERMIVAELSDSERAEPQGRWEYRLIARDGRVVWVIDDEAVIARDPDGVPTMVQGILVDITDRKDLEDQLRHQALHDPLTGLPNRVLFVDRLAHALVRRDAVERGIAVLFVDLDDFKAINDSLGHAAGDDLLRLVGQRLAGVLRAEDTACRLGGDEFAFLLEGADREAAEAIAGRILRALAEPFSLGARSATLSASIGVATRRPATEAAPAESADELLRDADTAMYAAKALGKGRVQVFERGMEEPITRRRQLQGSLERAIADEELFLEYQPIVRLDDRSIAGVEALVRWHHRQLGRVMPADFIGLAEAEGLIGRLGEWVLRRACADLAGGDLLLSVNVSAHQLGAGTLPGVVADALAASGLEPGRLLLELTESTLASAGAGAEAELQQVQALGVRIALDDFGSGYSSLEYLGRLPVDLLKLDRTLIERAHLEPQRVEVLRAIRHIAGRLRLDTVVEGVELEAQRRLLLDLGFDLAQGFLFSPAVPLAEAVAPTAVRRAS